MLPGDGPRRTLAQTLRLLVAVPPWTAGTLVLLTTLLPTFLFWTVLALAFLTALSSVLLAFAYAGEGTIPASALTVTVFRAVPVLAVTGILAFLAYRIRLVLRDRLQVEAVSLLAGTREPETDAGRRVDSVIEQLCQQVGQPTPTIRVRETKNQLCYTLTVPESIPADDVDHWNGIRAPGGERSGVPEGPVIVASTGLLESLRPDELTAVLAHEVAHLRNRDLTLMLWLLIPVHWGEQKLTDPGQGLLRPILVWLPAKIGMLVSLPGVVVFSRGREFAADAGAAELTGNPAALASALGRLDDTVERPSEDLRAVHVLNVLPTLGGGWTTRFSHPPTDRRIDRLREAQREMR